MELSIIIVNYNTKELLQGCIRSIFLNTKKVIYEIIVVDNNSIDDSQHMVKKTFPDVLLLCNKENVGFSSANNMAYEHSKGEYLLFLNSDTLILDGAIEKMINYLKTHPQVGIVGPKILDYQHQPCSSFQRFLDVKKLFLGSKYLKHVLDVEKYRMSYPSYDFTSIQDVEWVSGACLAVRRDVFEEVGFWDEKYFLYYEDMDLCYQVFKSGYRVVYYPEAAITHLFGQSARKSIQNLKKIEKNSMRYYFKKNCPLIHYWIAVIYSYFLYR
jgi:GT2 family glycosyltransferase